MERMNHRVSDDNQSNEIIILQEDDCITWTAKDWAGSGHLLFQGPILVSAYKTTMNNLSQDRWYQAEIQIRHLQIQVTSVIMWADLLDPTSESMHFFDSAQQPIACCQYFMQNMFRWIKHLSFLHV